MTWGQGGYGRGYVPVGVQDKVRRRDKTCRLAYPDICTGHIDEFDHIVGLAERGLGRRGTNTAEELQGVCTPCHRVKTEQQRRAGIARAKSKRLRPSEAHPGAL